MPSAHPIEVVADGEGLPEPAGEAMPEVAPPDQGSDPTTGAVARPRPRQDWRVLVAIFCLTSAIEGIGVSQIYAFVPSYLLAMGVPDADRFRFVGLFGSLIFVVGAPLVPLWGVWADKYSRKAVIVRSSVVMATVLVGIALSREPWQLAASMLLIGLQLGNTGVMLAEIRDVTPRPRLGRAIAVFGASSPVGFALGPAIGGVIVDGLHLGLPAVFAISAVLTLGIVLLVSLGSSEVRPEVVPKGSVLRLAFGAVRGVLADRAVLSIFAIFAITILATQMTRSYLPVLVESLVPGRAGLASAIALVTGVAALSGAVVSPIGGAIGDRIGFRPVLLGALVGAGCALFAMPIVGSVWLLALAALVLAAMYAAASAMVFGLLATEVAPERRSATLNLVYLPLYAAGTVGPVSGAVAVSAVGLSGPFLLGGTIFLAGAVAVGASVRRRGQLGRSRSAGPT